MSFGRRKSRLLIVVLVSWDTSTVTLRCRHKTLLSNYQQRWQGMVGVEPATYKAWEAVDQQLLSYILSSLSKEVLIQVD